MKKMILLVFAMTINVVKTDAQIKINNKTNIKIGGNKSATKASVKTKSGDKLSGSAGELYENYEKYLSENNYLEAENTLKKLKQKTGDIADLTLEFDELNQLLKNESTVSKNNNNRPIENDNQDEKYLEKERLDEKFSEIRYNLSQVLKVFNLSSGLGMDELKKGLDYFKENELLLKDIQAMVNDTAGEKDGGSNARYEVKSDLLPTFEQIFAKESEDYNLNKLAEKIEDTKINAIKAIQDNQWAAENARAVNDWSSLLNQLTEFCGYPEVLAQFKNQTDKILSDLKAEQNEKHGEYRSGDFHRKNGSGIYCVQKDGVTAQSLTEVDVTENILIDGTKPVHFFILTDLGLSSYASTGYYLKFDLVDDQLSMNQGKYVIDSDRILPIEEKELNLGHKKLVFIPSSDWNDLDETYSKSLFYECQIQERLADNLIAGEEKELTIYSASGQLQKTFKVTATQEGINFLKGMRPKMEKFEIDAARMEKPEAIDASLEQKIKTRFVASGEKQISIEKVVLTSDPWYIEKDVYGNILFRNCHGQVAYKTVSGKYFIQKVYCTQKYTGGAYGELNVTNRFAARQIRPENINK